MRRNLQHATKSLRNFPKNPFPTKKFWDISRRIANYNFDQNYQSETLPPVEDLSKHYKNLLRKKAVKMLKNVKAPEKDSVSYEIRKRSNKAIVESVQILFNKIHDTGYYPKSWNNDFVCPNEESGRGGTYSGSQDIRD